MEISNRENRYNKREATKRLNKLVTGLNLEELANYYESQGIIQKRALSKLEIAKIEGKMGG